MVRCEDSGTNKGYKRHKDVIANFNKDYVKTEIFPREIGRQIFVAYEFHLFGVDENKSQLFGAVLIQKAYN